MMNDPRSCAEDGIDPSLLKENLSLVESLKRKHPRPKGAIFYSLAKELGDPVIAEMIWLHYGILSFKIIGVCDPYFNSRKRSWWTFWKKKNTIRSLVKTAEGKKLIWQMLHDACSGR